MKKYKRITLAHSDFGIKPVRMALGEAAGVAAAIAVKEGISLKAVEAKVIQTVIGEYRCL